MKQITIFDELDAKKHEEESKAMYREWLTLPEEKLIPATSPERPGVHREMRRGFSKVWEKAIHRCHGMPPEAEIWLNEIEAPEFWVLNHGDNPCGERVEICPYCGANLKSGEGDVVLVKDDGALWTILGYGKEEE